MSKPFFHKEFASTTADVAEALTELLDALADEGWCHRENMFCIRLCLEEALVNAVVHGNQNEPGRSVTVQLHEENDRCRISVRDEGNGFDPTSVKMADCTKLGGRGVCLIKEYMDDVRFNAATKCLEMVFNRTTFSEACAG